MKEILKKDIVISIQNLNNLEEHNVIIDFFNKLINYTLNEKLKPKKQLVEEPKIEVPKPVILQQPVIQQTFGTMTILKLIISDSNSNSKFKSNSNSKPTVSVPVPKQCTCKKY